jgi:hypothetical protein
MKNLIITLLLLSCAKPEISPVEPIPDRLEELQEAQDKRVEKAIEIAETKNTWLVSESCDSMMWSALFGSQLEGYFKFYLAESEVETGRYYRRPSHDCFDTESSGSTWSRDMGLSLLIYLYSQGDLESIESHIAFGESTSPVWVMGDGLITRTPYSPALIGLWYKAAKALGHDYGVVIIPNRYDPGKIDYSAHLEILDVYLNGELDNGITYPMLARVSEHSNRVPDSVFYEVIRAKYKGNTVRATDMCLSDDVRDIDYLRCDGEPC